jgi:SAM-dependent methyltransferase
MELLEPASVVDLGCGLGTWLSVFAELGVEDVLGIDGEYVDRSALAIPADRFLARDLTRPLELPRTFDLAVSLEVAEHLPPDAAQTLVDSLTRHAPAVLFSAAIPGQDGVDHVNTQWPSYWRGLFLPRGYRAVDCIRPRIWDDEDVEFWYRQNLLLFVRSDVLETRPPLLAEAQMRRPLDLVHPFHWLRVLHQAHLDLEAARASTTEESG